MKRLACAILLFGSLATQARAQADDALFRAMSMMATGSGMAEALPPTIQDGNYFDILAFGVGASGNVLSPGPGGCSIIQTSVTQDRGKFAQVAVQTFDFARITGVRYLGPDDDFATAPSRLSDDPKADTISLDGTSWQCQRVVHIDPAKPQFAQFCENGWTIPLIGDDDRRAAREAIELIRSRCAPQ